MFGGMNPSKMKGMMKKMGISQEEVHATKVIFETDSGRLVIEEPSVVKIKMHGQETYQVSGEAVEEERSAFSEEDISMVKEKTKKSESEVRRALEESNGDIAEAMMNLRE